MFGKITEKQAAFVRLFAGDGLEANNATLSAIGAGYSERSACRIGSALLHHPMVRLNIDMALAEKEHTRNVRAGVTRSARRKAMNAALVAARKRLRKNLKKPEKTG